MEKIITIKSAIKSVITGIVKLAEKSKNQKGILWCIENNNFIQEKIAEKVGDRYVKYWYVTQKRIEQKTKAILDSIFESYFAVWRMFDRQNGGDSFQDLIHQLKTKTKKQVIEEELNKWQDYYNIEYKE